MTGGATGNGSGVVTYSVAGNSTSSSRSGTLTVAGQTFTATQAEVALAAVPGKIEFELLGVFHGMDSLVVHFQSKMHKCAEYMELSHEGKVRRATAHVRT